MSTGEDDALIISRERSLHRAAAACLATLALTLDLWQPQGRAFAAGDDPAGQSPHFADALVIYDFGWGNGQSWELSALDPRWHANATSIYGIIAERYVLHDPNGFAIDQRIGVSADIGDIDTVEVRIRALNSQYRGYPAQFNGALDVIGSVRHFRYEAGISQTGIEGAPSAQVDLITTAAVGERLDNMTAQLGWASRSTSAYVRGRLTTFSDGNRYSLFGFGAMQDLGVSGIDAQIGGFVNESGYAFTYPIAFLGYYTYPHETELALQALVRIPLGPHFEAAATGNAGTAKTAYFASHQIQSRQQFIPELRYTNRSFSLSASGSFAQYLGATQLPNFQGNRVNVVLESRL
ncbi:MAG: hypothetical protein JO194_06885 [Candidatus Eremiobacteraeota bacterium]|nr:hypothetical protein [Candidatus Eremiobacteraeota bacterium]